MLTNGNAKRKRDQATIYSSMFFSPILPATSVSDLKNAVRKANKNHVIP
jgi:acyl-CoA reductase-like NAD-dependent aldehyde dehydrogenase